MGSSLLDPLRALRNRSPVPYTSNRLSLPWRELSGAEAQMRAMGTVGTLFAIVNRTSNATALVEWKLWRKAPSGLKEDRTEVTTHPALDLWNRPNPFYTRQEFVETEQQHIDLTGEGWWVIARNPRSPIPLELWPVRPDRMQPIPDPTDFISGYMYTSPDGQKIPLGVQDVIQIRMPNPLDPYRGMGPVQSILTEIDASRYSAEWNRNFFLNSAEPGGILEVDKRLTDDEFNEHTARWAEQHKGVSNAHRVALLENGIKWVDRKLTQRDMQFAELRTVSRDVIREAFGAPAFILGEVGDVNRATALASKALFAEQLTVPRLERFKGALNNDLLPLYGRQTATSLEFDYEDPVPPDAAARNEELTAKANAAKTLIDAGLDSVAVLEYLGLPEMAYNPPITVRAQPAAPSAAPPTPPAARLDIHHHTAIPAAPAEVDVWRLPAFARALNRPRPVPRAQDPGADAVLEEVRAAFEERLAVLLADWDEQVLPDQYAAIEEQIRTAVDAGDPAALARLSVPDDEAVAVLKGALGGMATAAAEQMAAEAAAQGVPVKPPKVDRALRNAFGSELVDIAAAAAALLSSDMAASAGREALRLFTPGEDGAGVAGRVVTFLRGLKNWRRRDQLGGSLHRAQNLGRLATLAAAPVATYTAVEKLDGNTCPPCSDIDGTVFTDLAAAQAAYGAGPYRLCEGGIRCRGTVVATWDTATTARNGIGGDGMDHAYRCTNRAAGARPPVPAPDGTQSWYRITNAMEPGGNPCMHIYGDIGSWGITAAQCVGELAMIDAPVIDLYVNSPGGEVFDGLAIYNALRNHPAKIMVRVDALAASIASVIAMAGDRVTMSPGSQLMIHDAAGVSCGDAADLRKYADFLDAQSDNIASIYAERAGGTVKQWRARMRDETWYFADEAVDAGLADEVAKPVRQDTTAEQQALAASWDLSVYNYAHAGRDEAPAPDTTPLNAASPTHHTATVDSPWDGSVQEKRLPSPMTVATAKKMYGWYDSAAVDNGELPKSAGKLPHHEVSGDGTPGAANLAGVRNALARLPQSDIPEAQHAAIEAHLRAHLADGGSSQDHTDDQPTAAVFDPAAFRASTLAALDPMPGYQPEHMRSLLAAVADDAPAAPVTPSPVPVPYEPPASPSPEATPQDIAAGYFRSLMAGVANDAPAAPVESGPPPVPYEPPPVDRVPDAAPQEVAVGYFRSLMAAAANDAPTAPTQAATPPAAVAPDPVYVPTPPPPANEVIADYLRTVMTNVANNAPAPPQPPAPEPHMPEPVTTIDQTTVRRALWEAEL